MFKTYVPFSLENAINHREKIAEDLKKTNAFGAVIACFRTLEVKLVPDYRFEETKEAVKFFKEQGFYTCVWMGETMGHGMYSDNGGNYEKIKYRRFRPIGQKEEVNPAEGFCPTDENFAGDVCLWAQNIAKMGADCIFIDDDFRMTGHSMENSGIGCFCDYHLKKYCEAVGEDLTVEEVTEKVFLEPPSRYRDEWIKLQGETLYDFCRKIRNAVDEINDTVRICLCTAPSVFDTDGSDIGKIAKILAGKNKPMLRLFGAPYHAQSLSDGGLNTVFGKARLLFEKSLGFDGELIAEGDTFPRPREFCSSKFLELYDFAIRASGFDGILKYMYQYDATPYHETSYIDGCIKNQKLYPEIDKAFKDGELCGLEIFEEIHTFRDAHFTEKDWQGVNRRLRDRFNRAPFLTFTGLSSIPTTFKNGNGAVLVFGESARHIPESLLSRGVICDSSAARILKERGIDTGLISSEYVGSMSSEYYIKEKENVAVHGGVFNKMEIEPDAKTVTVLPYSETVVSCSLFENVETESGVKANEDICGCYLYENKKGQRFCVYAFDTTRISVKDTPMGLFCDIYRQKQLKEAIEWVQKKPLPAYCGENPFMYIMCKETENSKTVGIWNLFYDTIDKPLIELDEEFKNIEFIKGSGKLEGNKVIAETLPAFEFMCFKVSK